MKDLEPPTYISDILYQPKALRMGLAGWKDVDFAPIVAQIRSSERVVFTGMGSSYAALLPAWRGLVKAGFSAWHLNTAELLTLGRDFLKPNALIIAASQSGRSAEIIALKDQARGRAPIIALTNEPASPMTQQAAHVLELHSGVERAVSTRSYLNTLALASILATAVCNKGSWADAITPWTDAPAIIEGYLEDWRLRVNALKVALGTPDRLILLARGASLAAAIYGALIGKEAAKWPLEAMNAAQFRHGPLELADPRLTALILAGEEPADRDRNLRLASDVHRYGGRALWLDVKREEYSAVDQLGWIEFHPPLIELPHMPATTRPAAEILPLQLLSVALAELTGVEPGVFRHLQKVTSVE
jgi:glucosamine--fructose-6-phosphate aminotransferase (isomerizing)